MIEWKELKLKSCLLNRSENINEKYTGEIIYVDIGSVSYEKGILIKEKINFEQAPSRARKIVQNNDIIVSTVRTYLKSITRIINPENNLIVSTGFAVLKTKNNNSSHFFEYLLKSDHIQNIIKEKSKGVSYPSINNDELLSIVVNIPPLSQQTAIANFLDHQTSKIDKEISLLEKKVELLDELKQSTIYEAVTKGLNPDVKIKDSGIEWIGMIPEHWEVKRVKDLFNLKGGGCDKKIIEGQPLVNLVNYTDVYKNINLDNTQNYMVVSCEENKIKGISLQKNDLLITPSSETANEVGIVNVVLEDLINTVFSYHILRMRRKTVHISHKYAYYYFNSKLSHLQFENKATGTTRVTLSRYDINSNYIAMMSFIEQEKICKSLDNQCQNFDKKISLIKQKCILLKEYKQSLIFEAVTGKI